jgi:hypothetical protein
MSPHFDPETLAALHAVATQGEIDALVGIIHDMSRGYVPTWQIDFVIEIIRRLAAAADKRANHA